MYACMYVLCSMNVLFIELCCLWLKQEGGVEGAPPVGHLRGYTDGSVAAKDIGAACEMGGKGASYSDVWLAGFDWS